MASTKISILLIDDHALIRQSIAFFLEKDHAFTLVADTGDCSLALEIARTKRPDIVLLDISMTPFSGVDLLPMLRKLSPLSRIIILSMHAELALVRRLLRLGAKGYITKDSSAHELNEGIKEVHLGRSFICKKILNTTSTSETPAGLDALSQRELQVIKLLSEGHSSKIIGQQLNISSKTAEVHRYNILRKMKVKNTVALIGFINSQAIQL